MSRTYHEALADYMYNENLVEDHDLSVHEAKAIDTALLILGINPDAPLGSAGARRGYLFQRFGLDYATLANARPILAYDRMRKMILSQTANKNGNVLLARQMCIEYIRVDKDNAKKQAKLIQSMIDKDVDDYAKQVLDVMVAIKEENPAD